MRIKYFRNQDVRNCLVVLIVAEKKGKASSGAFLFTLNYLKNNFFSLFTSFCNKKNRIDVKNRGLFIKNITKTSFDPQKTATFEKKNSYGDQKTASISRCTEQNSKKH